ncbi:hypothetical protein ACFWXK_14410 [Streptomyces sp. NPDC059070]|uniref:hypothetical protein n=1 Tax=Streptomyces sp. NPDC059070 TaxID=3346713 RepID=UPI0036C14B9A
MRSRIRRAVAASALLPVAAIAAALLAGVGSQESHNVADPNWGVIGVPSAPASGDGGTVAQPLSDPNWG